MGYSQAQKSPAQGRAFGFLVAGAGLPSRLCRSVMSAGSAGLGMNLLRRTQPCLISKNEKGPRERTLLFILVAGVRCQRYLALVTALDIAT
jgi:hypothetical protein